MHEQGPTSYPSDFQMVTTTRVEPALACRRSRVAILIEIENSCDCHPEPVRGTPTGELPCLAEAPREIEGRTLLCHPERSRPNRLQFERRSRRTSCLLVPPPAHRGIPATDFNGGCPTLSRVLCETEPALSEAERSDIP